MNRHICNLISNINNGQLAKKSFIVQFPKKSVKKVLNVLWDEGFISGYKVSIKSIKIYLKYKNGVPAITVIKNISKPSLKVYYSLNQLWKTHTENSLIILSTNKGVMSDRECKKKNLGGEPFILVK